jgi:putative flippase GtrA
MNTIIELIRRLARHSVVRYAVVGGFAAVVDIGTFQAFTRLLHLDYRLAVFLSFTCGTLTNFALCNLFVFDRKDLSLYRAWFRHYVASIGGLITNEIVMITLVDHAGVSNLLMAKIAATGVAFVVNYTLMKVYAFNQNFSLSRRFLAVLGRPKGR